MPPKRISRTTKHLPTNDPSNAFVGVIDGHISLVDVGSGIPDESYFSGVVDADSLIEMGYTESEVEDMQAALDERIDEQLFGDNYKSNQ